MSNITEWLWTISSGDDNDKYAQAATRIEKLEASMFKAYCAGYELGHDMANENIYSPPNEWVEEWPRIRAELSE